MKLVRRERVYAIEEQHGGYIVTTLVPISVLEMLRPDLRMDVGDEPVAVGEFDWIHPEIMMAIRNDRKRFKEQRDALLAAAKMAIDPFGQFREVRRVLCDAIAACEEKP